MDITYTQHNTHTTQHNTHTCGSCILHYCHGLLTNNTFGALVLRCLNIHICPHPVRPVRQSTKYSSEIMPRFIQPQTHIQDTYKISERTVSFKSQETLLANVWINVGNVPRLYFRDTNVHTLLASHPGHTPGG